MTFRGTITAVLLGFVFPYAMVYSRMSWKPFFRVIAILPMLSPPFEVAARNEQRATIHWQYTLDDARVKLRRLYPS